MTRLAYRLLALALCLTAGTVRAEEPADTGDSAEQALDYEAMFALASDCSVSLAMLDSIGADIHSSPDDWINVMINLEKRIDRDAYLEYQFRETEISALLEVEPETTEQWMMATARQCAALLPEKDQKAQVGASQGSGPLAPKASKAALIRR